ncbi:MAG: phosphodiesterase, partial [Pseudomonadota bacterium]
GYAGPLAVMSFNPHSVAKMAELAPDLPRGLTTCAFEAEHWPTLPSKHRAELARLSDVARIGAAFISHDHRSLTMDPVQVLKRGGIPILTWTIRSAREAQKARATADQITFEHYLPA